MLFLIVVLWIAGVSTALYGIGLVVDERPQILGSGGCDPGRRHVEHLRLPHLAVGLMLMAAAWTIGKTVERCE